MPDCENELVVTGPPDDLLKLRELVSETTESYESRAFSFDAARAMPEGLRWVSAESPADVDPDEVQRGAREARNAQEWALARWGSRWREGRSELVDNTPGRLVYRLVTPGRTPDALLEYLSEQFEALVFDCTWSVGDGPAGRYRCQGGYRQKAEEE